MHEAIVYFINNCSGSYEFRMLRAISHELHDGSILSSVPSLFIVWFVISH